MKRTERKKKENSPAFSLTDTQSLLFTEQFSVLIIRFVHRRGWKHFYGIQKKNGHGSTQSLHLLRNLPITHSVTHSHQSIKSFATLHGNFTCFFFIHCFKFVFFLNLFFFSLRFFVVYLRQNFCWNNEKISLHKKKLLTNGS